MSKKGSLAHLLLLQLAAVVVGVPGVVGEGHRHGHSCWLLLLLEGFGAAIAAAARARRGRGLATRGENVCDALRRCLHANVRLLAQSVPSQAKSCEVVSCRGLGVSWDVVGYILHECLLLLSSSRILFWSCHVEVVGML